MLQVFSVQRLDFRSFSGFFHDGEVGVSASQGFTQAGNRERGIVVDEHGTVFRLVASNDFYADQFGVGLVKVLDDGVAFLGSQTKNPDRTAIVRNLGTLGIAD